MADPATFGPTEPAAWIVVGGGPAAVAAALRLAEEPAGPDVDLIAPGPAPGAGRRLWPALIAGDVSRREIAELAARRLAGGRVRWLRGTAGAVDAERSLVTIHRRDGPVDRRFRGLIWAAGPAAPELTVPGRDLPGVFAPATTQAVLAFAEYLDHERPHRGVVVGAGPLALEIADALHRRRIHVTVFDGARPLLPGFDPAIARAILPELRRAGVPFYTDSPLTALEPGRRGHRAGRLRRIGSHRTSVVADFVVLVESDAGGDGFAAIAPAGSGRVFPAGAAISGRYPRSEVWLAASGVAAAEAALGHDLHQPPDRGVIGVRAFGIEIARTALPVNEAETAVEHRLVEARSPEIVGPAGRVRLRLSVESGSGCLLAAQVAARTGAAARARVLAVAARAGLTVADLAGLDLDLQPRPGRSAWPDA